MVPLAALALVFATVAQAGATADRNKSAYLSAANGAVAARGYQATPLPALSSIFAQSSADGINALGQVAGTSNVGGTPSGRVFWHATLWTPGVGLRDLDTRGGVQLSGAYAVNDAGHVVGYDFGTGTAFRWTPESGIRSLEAAPGSPAQAAADINNAGQVVGRTLDDSRALLWDAAGGVQVLGPGSAEAINDPGQVVGTTGAEAFVWTPGQGIATFSVGGARTVATDINDHGHVVGYYSVAGGQNGFLWTAADGIRLLGSVWPRAINEAGTVVGRSENGFGFVWTDEHGLTDLNTLIDPADALGRHVAEANDINDAGQIAANAGGFGLLLTPIPELGTLALFALGLLGGRLAVGRRAKRC
jgi:uncharacterized membrane protein